MNIDSLREWANNKDRFSSVEDFLDFGRAFVEYRQGDAFQAELVAKNTPKYRFFQYSEEAGYQITRPINSELFYEADDFDAAIDHFRESIDLIADNSEDQAGAAHRDALNRVIYTAQQSIGAALDALPRDSQNKARKLHGDLFERFIGLIINECGVECRSGVLRIPVKDESGKEMFKMNYQHDLMVSVEGDLKAIGSVKTSSKDRIDKVFIDKFLYNRLTGVATPHFAIFLNDVQRKGKEPNYGTSNTFLPGHFKGYTVKLNPLDGVYYCDLLPKMESDPLLSSQISRVDRFFIEDMPKFVATAPSPDVDEAGGDLIENT